jgi:uncharacterized protein (DUF58 family)
MSAPNQTDQTLDQTTPRKGFSQLRLLKVAVMVFCSLIVVGLSGLLVDLRMALVIAHWFLLVALMVYWSYTLVRAKKVTIRFRNTLAGFLWLIFAAFMLAIGWAKGINLLLLFAYPLLLIWILNFALAGRHLHQLQAKRTIDGPIFAQTPFAEDVDFANPDGTPQIGVRLIDKGPDHLQSWFVPSLATGASVHFAKQMTLPRRGRYALEPLRAWSAYPFGLVQRTTVVGKTEDDLIVLPRLGQVHRGKLRRFLTHTAPQEGVFCNPQRSQPLSLNEFHSLRPFRRGDSPRWIHWRTSARRGELMVREFEKATTESLLLILDACVYLGSNEDLFEQAVSLTATICWEYCRQHGDRLVLAIASEKPVISAGTTGAELSEKLLRSLALEPGNREPAWERLLELLTPGSVPSGPILLVSPTKTALGDEIARHLHRPVTVVNVTELDRCDFYERPTRAS